MKERIKNVLSFRKPLRAVIIAAVALIAVLTIGFVVNRRNNAAEIISYPESPYGGEFAEHWAGFTSDSEGWFVGTPGVAMMYSETYVYLTHDGGKTWEETGNVIDEWPCVLNCAAFADAQTGYLCFRYDIENMGRVYQTTDGGKTWKQFEIPNFAALAQQGVGEVRAIEFDGDGNGTMQFYFRNEHNESQEGTTLNLVSGDKGQTWLTQFSGYQPPIDPDTKDEGQDDGQDDRQVEGQDEVQNDEQEDGWLIETAWPLAKTITGIGDLDITDLLSEDTAVIVREAGDKNLTVYFHVDGHDYNISVYFERNSATGKWEVFPVNAVNVVDLTR